MPLGPDRAPCPRNINREKQTKYSAGNVRLETAKRITATEALQQPSIGVIDDLQEDSPSQCALLRTHTQVDEDRSPQSTLLNCSTFDQLLMSEIKGRNCNKEKNHSIPIFYRIFYFKIMAIEIYFSKKAMKFNISSLHVLSAPPFNLLLHLSYYFSGERQLIATRPLNLYIHRYFIFPRGREPTQTKSSLLQQSINLYNNVKGEKHHYLKSILKSFKHIRQDSTNGFEKSQIQWPLIRPFLPLHKNSVEAHASCLGGGTRSPHGRGLGITFPFFPTIKLAQHTPRPLPCSYKSPSPLSAPS